MIILVDSLHHSWIVEGTLGRNLYVGPRVRAIILVVVEDQDAHPSRSRGGLDEVWHVMI